MNKLLSNLFDCDARLSAAPWDNLSRLGEPARRHPDRAMRAAVDSRASGSMYQRGSWCWIKLGAGHAMTSRSARTAPTTSRIPFGVAGIGSAAGTIFFIHRP